MTFDELKALATVKDGPHLRFQPPYQQMSVTIEEAELLYALVRALKPRNVLELGTGLGLSGRFIAEALVTNDYGWLMTEEPEGLLAEEAIQLLHDLPAQVTVPKPTSYVYANYPDLVYIDSAASRRPADIYRWLSNGDTCLILIHDTERDYPEIKAYGRGVYLPTANGMWLGRAK